MDGRAFREGVETVLRPHGFARSGKVLARSDDDVSTLVRTAKGFGRQWHVDVGFWLEGLSGTRPDRVERCHLYYRLERLLADQHETIALAGALGEPGQEAAYGRLLEVLGDAAGRELRELGTEGGLRSAMADGRLDRGVVTREAREYLTTPRRLGATRPKP
jgi:hypothetical protein